jgi:membrane-associated phospholipid phosphatase
MYIGAHYRSDVVCAAVMGTSCALLVGHFLFLQIRTRQLKFET